MIPTHSILHNESVVGTTTTTHNHHQSSSLDGSMGRQRRQVTTTTTATNCYDDDTQTGSSTNAINNASTHHSSQLQQEHGTTTKTMPSPHSSSSSSSLQLLQLQNEGITVVVIGSIGGLVAYMYYIVLETLLHIIWKSIPMYLWNNNEDTTTIIWWIPIATLTMATCMATVMIYWGEPIDLVTTVHRVHASGYVDIVTVVPTMALTSLCSITAGASLGPEAPLVTISAAVAGWVGKRLLLLPQQQQPQRATSTTDHSTNENDDDDDQQRQRLRHCTILGMACATAAFFGCPLGGSLFAIEVVTARYGHVHNYFQHHALSAIMAGTLSLCVFRYLAQLPIGPIWDFTTKGGTESTMSMAVSKLPFTQPIHIVYGIILGVVGAMLTCAYALFRGQMVHLVQSISCLRLTPTTTTASNDTTTTIITTQHCHHRARALLLRAWIAGCILAMIGMMVPSTLFWGEYEFQIVATMAPIRELPHLLSPRSIITSWNNDDTTTPNMCFIIGTLKFMAIAISIAGGYRGGFIFPLFTAAAAYGRWIHYYIVPFIPVQLCVLCLASAVNVAVTRTTLATPLILTYLSGEPHVLTATLVASLISYHITSLTPWVYTPPTPPVATTTAPPTSANNIMTSDSMDISRRRSMEHNGSMELYEKKDANNIFGVWPPNSMNGKEHVTKINNSYHRKDEEYIAFLSSTNHNDNNNEEQ